MSIRLLVAAIVSVGLFLFATSTWATGWHKPPMSNPPAPPTVVSPPASAPVTPPATASNSSQAPAQSTASSRGSAIAGGIAFAFVAASFWYVICAAEQERDPRGFVARYLCLKRTGWTPRPTLDHMMPTFANP